jgi:hypothetical protein
LKTKDKNAVTSKFHKSPPAILLALLFLSAAVFEAMAATANSFTLDLLWSAPITGAPPSSQPRTYRTESDVHEATDAATLFGGKEARAAQRMKSY